MERGWGQAAGWWAAMISIVMASGCGKTASRSSAAAVGEAPEECTSLPPLAQKSTYTIGFVQVYEPTNPYTIANTADMIAEAKKRGYNLVHTAPASADIADQVGRMNALTAAKVDAMILRPLAGLGPAVVAARKACIPVFSEGRLLDPALATPGQDYVTYIGTDSVVQGQLIADWLIKAKGGAATIIEIEGTAGTSPAIGRKKGFDGRIASQPSMKIVASESGSFDRATGHDVAKKLLGTHPNADVIYAHSDYMALGALDAVKELGKAAGKDVIIVSIDGLKEAVQRVVDGTIAAIEFNDPKLASISFDTMEHYASGQPIPPKIIVKGPVIDSTNAAAMLPEAF